jgi:hypothetical protein
MKPMNEKRPEAVFRNRTAARMSIAEQLPSHGISNLAFAINSMETGMLLLELKRGRLLKSGPCVPWCDVDMSGLYGT